MIVVGNVGKDPEVRYSRSGTPVANFSLATNERFKDRNDEWQERTEWHCIVAWQRLAELVGEYVAKGSNLYVEGRFRVRAGRTGSAGRGNIERRSSPASCYSSVPGITTVLTINTQLTMRTTGGLPTPAQAKLGTKIFHSERLRDPGKC